MSVGDSVVPGNMLGTGRCFSGKFEHRCLLVPSSDLAGWVMEPEFQHFLTGEHLAPGSEDWSLPVLPVQNPYRQSRKSF